jgi:hypothetical protein
MFRLFRIKKLDPKSQDWDSYSRLGIIIIQNKYKFMKFEYLNFIPS